MKKTPHWKSDVKTAIKALTAILDSSENTKAFIKQKIAVLEAIQHLLSDTLESFKKQVKK